MPYERADATGQGTARVESGGGFSDAQRSILSKLTPSGEGHAAALRSAGRTGTGQFCAPERLATPRRSSATTRPGNGVAIKLAFGSCIEALDRALGSEDDFVERANAIADLRAALDRLWLAREGREREFGDAINHLQCLLLAVPAEEIPLPHVSAIRKVIMFASGTDTLTAADLRDLVGVLVKAGCNVFRETE